MDQLGKLFRQMLFRKFCAWMGLISLLHYIFQIVSTYSRKKNMIVSNAVLLKGIKLTSQTKLIIDTQLGHPTTNRNQENSSFLFQYNIADSCLLLFPSFLLLQTALTYISYMTTTISLMYHQTESYLTHTRPRKGLY